MRAAQIQQFGDFDNIVISDVPEPAFNETQLLVEVKSASLNPADYKLLSGKVSRQQSFPFTLGGDFSGVVQRVGKQAVGFKPGEQVYGQAIVLNGGSGSIAELVSSNAVNTFLKPLRSSFSEAAALPLTGTSAIQALEDNIRLKKNQKILIHGGAGGIGSIAIQLAKTIGAFVATTVSEKDMLFVKELGADVTIDYRKEQFDEILADYDAVLDTVGGEVYSRSFRVLKKGGVINSMIENPEEKLEEQFGVTAIGQFTITNSQRLGRLAKLVDNEDLRPYIDKKFPLDQTKEAFRYLKTAHSRGKVVINII